MRRSLSPMAALLAVSIGEAPAQADRRGVGRVALHDLPAKRTLFWPRPGVGRPAPCYRRPGSLLGDRETRLLSVDDLRILTRGVRGGVLEGRPLRADTGRMTLLRDT